MGVEPTVLLLWEKLAGSLGLLQVGGGGGGQGCRVEPRLLGFGG